MSVLSLLIGKFKFSIQRGQIQSFGAMCSFDITNAVLERDGIKIHVEIQPSHVRGHIWKGNAAGCG